MSMQAINRQAADWLLRLDEGELAGEERADFEAWKQADPQHAAALERMQGFVIQLQALRPQQAPVRIALDAAFRRPPRSKRGATALLLLLALGLPSGLLWRALPPGYLLADYSTAPAQWQRRTLDDRSQLTLAGNSAVDVHFDASQRRIELLRGEILVEVAHDPQRPFIVATEQGEIRALGTRFVVRREGDSTWLTMLESRVAAHAADNPAVTEVGAGEQARIRRQRVERQPDIDATSFGDAWQSHQLVVQDQPLTTVLEQLGTQRRGYLHYDAAALADLRVSAVLPLDDSERALRLIGEALPVQIRQVTPWLVLVSRRP